ncbi:MAG: hypothetical protein K5663_11195 [Clostridiales bacterium]|nr:hypothetical protein [Clostridiales bacterium]
MLTVEEMGAYFSRYDADVIIDRDCKAEIYKIVSRSGKRIKFTADYGKRIGILIEQRENAPGFNHNWFELLRHVKEAPLYSLHMANIDNLRILYVIRKRIILLCAFKEKEEHGKKTDSYVEFIPVALNRLQRYKEEE